MEQLLSGALLAERRMILQLRNEQVINDEVLRHIQRDLDLAELRLTRTGRETSPAQDFRNPKEQVGHHFFPVDFVEHLVPSAGIKMM